MNFLDALRKELLKASQDGSRRKIDELTENLVAWAIKGRASAIRVILDRIAPVTQIVEMTASADDGLLADIVRRRLERFLTNGHEAELEHVDRESGDIPPA